MAETELFAGRLFSPSPPLEEREEREGRGGHPTLGYTESLLVLLNTHYGYKLCAHTWPDKAGTPNLEFTHFRDTTLVLVNRNWP